jgi:ferredoxin--NADP+ reductase
VSSELNAIVVQRIEVSPGLVILRVVPEGWELPDFEPGQYAVLALPGSAPRTTISDPENKPSPPEKLIKRAYSIASSSKAKEYVEFYVSLVPSGQLTPGSRPRRRASLRWTRSRRGATWPSSLPAPGWRPT